MPTLLTIWGIMVTLQGLQLGGFCFLWSDVNHTFFTPGLVTSYAGLATVRAFLGLVEGPMFPGIVLYLSGFYTRKELSLRYMSHLWLLFWCWSLHWSSRIALFFSAASVCHEISSWIICGLSSPLALGRFFWVACCRNRKHGWDWWKTRMVLDLHSRTFLWCFFYIISLHPSNTSIGRIVFSSHWPPQLYRCPLNTTRFQVFIWGPERVSLSCLYTTFHLLN